MQSHKLIFIVTISLLTVISAGTANPDTPASKSHYDYATETFNGAQRAEEAARLSSFASDVANYYEVAIESYILALKKAQLSTEELEKLSKRQKDNRQRMINECREKIELCQHRYNEIIAVLNVDELKQKAVKYVVEGFEHAVGNNTSGAKRSWDKAIRLYQEALGRTEEEPAEQELIKSKIQEVLHYIESYL